MLSLEHHSIPWGPCFTWRVNFLSTAGFSLLQRSYFINCFCQQDDFFFPASAIPWSRVWLETTWQEGPGGHCPVSQLCETHSRCKKLWHDNSGSLFLTLKGVQDGFGSHSTGIWEILDEFSWKPLHVTLGWSSCWDMVLRPPNLAEGTDKFYALKTFCRSSFIWAVRTLSKSEAQLLCLNDSHKRIPAQMGEFWGSSGHWDSASFVERSFL